MPRIPLDPAIGKTIVALSDVVTTTSSCQGHGRGEKKLNICIQIPKSDKEKLNLFLFLIKILDDRRVSIQMSPGGNLSVYAKYSRTTTLEKILNIMNKTIKKFVKESK